MKIRLARDLQPDSIVDGEGIRTVLWTQGCIHNCPDCHNPETHNPQGGYEVEIEDLEKEIDQLQGQDGITLSGGDPMLQPQAIGKIAEYSKKKGLNVWCYTGFTFEQLLKRVQNEKDFRKTLENIDVLVDGRFEKEQKSLNLYFKGSRNKRILDMAKSLEQGKPVEIENYKEERTVETYKRKEENIYI